MWFAVEKKWSVSITPFLLQHAAIHCNALQRTVTLQEFFIYILVRLERDVSRPF